MDINQIPRNLVESSISRFAELYSLNIELERYISDLNNGITAIVYVRDKLDKENLVLLARVEKLEKTIDDSNIIFGEKWQQSVERTNGVLKVEKFTINQCTKLAGDVAILKEALENLIQECEYSINSGPHFTSSWAHLKLAKEALLKCHQ